MFKGGSYIVMLYNIFLWLHAIARIEWVPEWLSSQSFLEDWEISIQNTHYIQYKSLKKLT